MEQKLQRYLREKEAAEYLAVSVALLRKRRSLRQPPPYTKIGARVIYNLTELEAFVASGRVPAGGELRAKSER